MVLEVSPAFDRTRRCIVAINTEKDWRWKMKRRRDRNIHIETWLRLEQGALAPGELMPAVDGKEIRESVATFEGELFEYQNGRWQRKLDMVKQILSLDEFIEEARRLRAASQEAEARFLLYLRAFETEREDLWHTDGVVTFDSFIQSYALANVARYRNFCAGVKRLVETNGDAQEAESMGTDAVIDLGAFKNPTPTAVDKFKELTSRFRAEHDVAPSRQTTTEWRKRLDQQEPRVRPQLSRVAQLEADNQALRVENRELKRKLKAAEQTIAKLTKKPAVTAVPIA